MDAYSLIYCIYCRSKDLKHCQQRILPTLGRLVVFSSTGEGDDYHDDDDSDDDYSDGDDSDGGDDDDSDDDYHDDGDDDDDCDDDYDDK
jgi:hypothetical protein